MCVFLPIGVSLVETEDRAETNTNQETVPKAGSVRRAPTGASARPAWLATGLAEPGWGRWVWGNSLSGKTLARTPVVSVTHY